MAFIVLNVQVPEDLSDIVKVELSELGFDSFLDHDTGFEASVPVEEYDETAVQACIAQYNHTNQITWQAEEVEKQNWNKLWETNFHPIEISKECYIRAAFHPPKEEYKYQLVITPKMSFGTGHHSTTSLMIQHQLMIEHQGKTVFDIGCGTGVLAIMAAKLGATKVVGCDIEDWSVENTLENAQMNDVTLEAFEGVVEDVEGVELYDIVLANINLNVHKNSMADYVRVLKTGGYLLLSGFYQNDIPTVEAMAEALHLQKFSEKVQQEWTSIVYKK